MYSIFRIFVGRACSLVGHRLLGKRQLRSGEVWKGQHTMDKDGQTSIKYAVERIQTRFHASYYFTNIRRPRVLTRSATDYSQANGGFAQRITATGLSPVVDEDVVEAFESDVEGTHLSWIVHFPWIYIYIYICVPIRCDQMKPFLQRGMDTSCSTLRLYVLDRFFA